MTQKMAEPRSFDVPEWVNDLESFRRWSDDDAYPEYGRIAFLRGALWIDMSKEQLFTHNAVKAEVNSRLYALTRAERLGRYFHDGAFVSNEAANVSNQPDGVFVSSADLAGGRVRVIEGRTRGHVELEGTPAMVLEVASDSSVDKDTVVLRSAFAAAGVGEYWLVDARSSEIRFDLFVLAKKAYRLPRKAAGWSYSPAFSRYFRLMRSDAGDGFAEFTLEARAERP
ncbi:MAG: Uma2 family endonuclease [Gemmataceae bacterium]